MGLAKLFAQGRAAQDAANPCQGPQVLSACIGWRKEGKEQINGLFVDSLEVNRCFETHKDAPHPLEAAESCVRYTHPVANTRRAKLLTLEQGL
jgi:hypothetical protein